MKQIFILLCISSFLFSNQSFIFTELYGTWTLESIRGNSYVVFGEVKAKRKGDSLSLQFLQNGKVYVKGTEVFYYYNIEYGKLVLSKHKNQKNNHFVPANHNIDRLYKDQSFQGCPIVKYSQKGLTAIYDNGGYQMCHIELAPQPTYTVPNPLEEH
ncbi:MAG: hypothetical protein COA44_11190 [Arcobacter sp.]|nr:MAG: hypothetical protein COA44_11190 [Arcobacter sp.]